jgi:hypothetical protein
MVPLAIQGKRYLILKKSKAKGMLVVTNKALRCIGNVYPYDKMEQLQGTKNLFY